MIYDRGATLKIDLFWKDHKNIEPDAETGPDCHRFRTMEDLLIALFQFVIEFVFEVLGNWPVDWIFSSSSREKPETLAGWCFLWLIFGAGIAGISILILHRTWISHPALRIANLFLAPIVSAFISEAMARRRQRRRSDIVPRNHFWQAFWFTLGIVTVRFAYASR